MMKKIGIISLLILGFFLGSIKQVNAQANQNSNEAVVSFYPSDEEENNSPDDSSVSDEEGRLPQTGSVASNMQLYGIIFLLLVFCSYYIWKNTKKRKEFDK